MTLIDRRSYKLSLCSLRDLLPNDPLAGENLSQPRRLGARDLLNCVSKGVPQAITSGDQKFEIVTKQLSSPTS